MNFNFEIDFYKNFYEELNDFDSTELFNHYLNNSEKENIIISYKNFYNTFPDFSLEFYKEFNKDLIIMNDINLLKHYYFNGQFENRISSYKDFYLNYPNFDIIFYKEFNLDLNNLTNIELLIHYYTKGIIEDRISSKIDYYKKYPKFDIIFYRDFNSDLNNITNIELLIHYHNKGKDENRISCDIDFYKKYPNFNIIFYKNFYYDLYNINDDKLLEHYNNNGIIENRISSFKEFQNLFVNFNFNLYKYLNEDLLNLDDISLLIHYYNFGRNENRYSTITDFYKKYPNFNLDIYNKFKINEIDEINEINEIDEINEINEINNYGIKDDRYPGFISYLKSKLYLNNDEIGSLDDLVDFNFNLDLYKTFSLYNKIISSRKIIKNNLEISPNEIKNDLEVSSFEIKDDLEVSPNEIKNDLEIFSIKIKDDLQVSPNKIKNDLEVSSNKDLEIFLDEQFKKGKEIFLEETDLELIYKFYKNDKTKIVYSLKTFYKNFPNFDYHKFRQYHNLINMGEVESIIYWYNNDRTYDFLLNNKKYSQKKNIIIYTNHIYSDNCGGILVQYYLAKILDKHGQKVRIKSSEPIYINTIFNNYDEEDFDRDNTIVIYGETIEGNPLNAKYVVRWILAKLGIIADENIYRTWNKNDLVYYFNNELKFNRNPQKIGIIYKNLSILFINPDIKNYNNIRKGYCHTFRKTEFHISIFNIHPDDSFEITRKHKQDDYIEIFNKYKYFISYDPLTFLSIIASLCGCISIIYPIEGINKGDWIKMTSLYEYVKDRNLDNIYGIAYGDSIEEITYANNTLHLVEKQCKDILALFRNLFTIILSIIILNIF